MTPITTEIKSEAHQSTGTVIAFGGTMGKSGLCESAFPANQPHPSIAFKGLSQSLGHGMNTSAMLDCGGCFGKDEVFFLPLLAQRVRLCVWVGNYFKYTPSCMSKRHALEYLNAFLFTIYL
ncbi:hypothetical protein TNCT_340211 [Trichonephila clavata]|uniref:Uncharacterized protein n=1 Tax=Trichonephila clavata TaxID=2740835 RepID=A0A8X6I0S5_TRICU|nr:hypothetical protein TNCT_340211 [Trichonephila clavata]